MEDMMHERIGRLCQRIQDAIPSGEVVSLDSAFSALTADLIMERFYGYHLDYLGIPDFQSIVTIAFLGNSLMFHFARFFPHLAAILKKTPLWLLHILQPAVAELQSLQNDMKSRILSSIDKVERTEFNKSIIISALNNANIPTEERSLDRLLDEGLVIIFAGTETSSRAISVAFFHLLNDKRRMEKLRTELHTLPPASAHQYTLAQLENLPYLVSRPI